MTDPVDLEFVSSHLALWHTFDPSVKAELFATAILTTTGTLLVDPIPLHPEALTDLQGRSPVRAIVITNQNHWRASSRLAEQLSVPIFAHDSARLADDHRQFTAVADGQRLEQTLEVFTIEGAAPGEIALFCELDAGTLIIGDALINFEPYGFTFLPPKYCADQRKMKKSLRRLGNLSVERIFFAHGVPILSRAGSRLQALLDEG